MNHTKRSERLINFDHIPDELLLEIFKWISFEELASGVKLVNKRWRKIASTKSLHPDVLVITKGSNPKTIHHIISHYGDNLCAIKLRDIYESGLMATLNSRHWSNLRTFSIEWKDHNILNNVRLPVTYLNWVIDRSPRLTGIELRECFIHGDMDSFLDKLRNRRICELTIVNTYLVVNGMEKLFDLRDMTKFRVCCYPLGNLSSRICAFCANNRHSLTSLALRIDDQSTGSADVVEAISSCSMLRRLQLIGRLDVSSEALLKISQLEKLKCLKIQAHSIDSQELAGFLKSSFTRQLTVLGIHWSRPVVEGELEGIIDCENLTKLTLMFTDHFNDIRMICAVLPRIVKKLRLKKLKIISNFAVVDSLPEICLQGADLFYIKLIHGYKLADLKRFKNQMRTLSALYDSEYSIYKSELRITLRKRINTGCNF